jgi:hypothetical protein
MITPRLRHAMANLAETLADALGNAAMLMEDLAVRIRPQP